MVENPRYKLEIDSAHSVATEPEIDILFDLNETGDRGAHDGTMWCPVTRTIFARPRQFEPGFTPAPLTLTPTDPTNWEDLDVGSAGNTFKCSKNASAGWVATASQAANVAFVVTFYCYGSTGAMATYNCMNLEFGAFTLALNSDGLSNIGTQRGYLTGGYARSGRGRNAITDRWVRILVMPLNRRDILIYSDQGGAWVYRQDLPLDNANNEIIGAAAIRAQFPNSKGLVQIQAASWPASSTYTTELIDIGYAPATGRAVSDNASSIHKDGAVTGKLVKLGGADYAPDGSTRQVAAKFTFTGAGQLYSAQWNIEGARQARSSSPSEIAYSGLKLSGEGAQVGLDPFDLDNTQGWITGARPGASMTLKDQADNELMYGLMGMPSLDGVQAPSMQAKIDPLWTALKQAVFRTDWRYDSMLDSDVIEKCLRLAGIDVATRADIQVGTALPADPRGKVTLFRVKAGTSAEAVAKAVADLWSNRRLEMRSVSGTQKVCYKDDTSPAATATFYQSHLAGGHRLTYWKLEAYKGPDPKAKGEEHIPWNGVVVRGQDVDGGKFLYDSVADTDAQNPNLAEGSRPDNWYGAPIPKYYDDPRLVTQAAVTHVKDVLVARFLQRPIRVQWLADYNESLSPGTVVTLENQGSYRIEQIMPLGPGEAADSGRHEFQYVRYVGVKVN